MKQSTDDKFKNLKQKSAIYTFTDEISISKSTVANMYHPIKNQSNITKAQFQLKTQ